MFVAHNPPQLIRTHSAKMPRVPMRPVAMRRTQSTPPRPSSPISVRTRPVDSPSPPPAPPVVPPRARRPRRGTSAPPALETPPRRRPPRDLGRYIKPVSALPYDPTFHYRSGDYMDIPVADPKTGERIFARVPALPADAAAAGRRRVRETRQPTLRAVQAGLVAGAATTAACEAAGLCNVMGGGRTTRRRRRKRRSFRKTKAKKNRRRRTRRRRRRRRRRTRKRR